MSPGTASQWVARRHGINPNQLFHWRKLWQPEPEVNVKRVYRVMRDHDLLLEKRRKQPGVARRHEGRVAVGESNTRWCSDGFGFRCDDGAKLRVTFVLDCCRELSAGSQPEWLQR